MLDIEKYLKETKKEIEEYMSSFFPPDMVPHPLGEAMRYALLNGGKRVRAILAITIGRGLQGQDSNILPFAAALEMIHAYSLVHDDLPAMDNDDYRRGQLTTHKKFGEAMGILTGDALLTHAFWVIAGRTQEPTIIPDLVRILALDAGIEGMVAGQVADVLAERQKKANEILKPQSTDAELLEYIHRNKTMALILAACEGGAVTALATKEVREQIAEYGRKIGLAFQIVDDVLDVEGTEQAMGKKVHKDSALGKLTYPGLWGLEKSKAIAAQLLAEACQIVAHLPCAEHLAALARFIVARTY